MHNLTQPKLNRSLTTRQKLEYARQRAVEILPLCENATGIKLTHPLKIKPYRLSIAILATIPDLLRRLSPHSGLYGVWGALTAYSRVPAHEVPNELERLAKKCGLGGWIEQLYDAASVYGLIMNDLGLRINLSQYPAGSIEADYVLAHELTHLLLMQSEPHIVKPGLGRPWRKRAEPELMINANPVLSEGAATYYGEMAARSLDPSFTVECMNHPDMYMAGYKFFVKVAVHTSNVLELVQRHPPKPEALELGSPDRYIWRIVPLIEAA